MSTFQIIIAIIFFIAIGGAMLVCSVRLMNRAVYRQVGETRSWYVTVQHGDGSASPDDCWTTAIDAFAAMHAELIREWGSHAEVGDRSNREYRLDDTIVLLELDRWNGFTMSGDPDKLKPVADRLQLKTEIR